MYKKQTYPCLHLFVFLFLSIISASCSKSLAPGDYMLSRSAGNESNASNYLGRATTSTIKQSAKVEDAGKTLLFVQFNEYSNRMQWDKIPVVVIPDEGMNKTLVNKLNESLASIEASNTTGIPVEGNISTESIDKISFKVDSVHKFLAIDPNSVYDYSKMCSSSNGIYNGKVQKAVKDQLNYIQKIYQISGKFELEAKVQNIASLQAEIEKLSIETKGKWSKKDNKTFVFEVDRSWAMVEVVPMPKSICEQVAGQYVKQSEAGYLKKKSTKQ